MTGHFLSVQPIEPRPLLLALLLCSRYSLIPCLDSHTEYCYSNYLAIVNKVSLALMRVSRQLKLVIQLATYIT